MPTPKYTFDLKGLKEKCGADLQKEVRQNLNYSIGQIEAIARMAGMKTLIKSIEPTDNPLIFNIHLIDIKPGYPGPIIEAERVGWFNNQYTFSMYGIGHGIRLTYNSYTNIDLGLLRHLKEKYVTNFTECKYKLEHYDADYHFSDDHRSWSAGEASRKRIIELYEKCNDEEKKILKSLKKAEHFNFI